MTNSSGSADDALFLSHRGQPDFNMTATPVRIGVNFDGFVTTGEAIALAQRAVDAGARSLWVAEHLGYREAIATCVAFAIKAPGPMLVPTAVSPYLWHPTPTAMAMATLDEVAPGCAAIAIGAGNPLFLQESGRAVERPVRAMRQFTEALRALWSGEAVHIEGEFVTLAGARLAFRPSAPIPIYIAAMGPDMLRLAGRMLTMLTPSRPSRANTTTTTLRMLTPIPTRRKSSSNDFTTSSGGPTCLTVSGAIFCAEFRWEHETPIFPAKAGVGLSDRHPVVNHFT